MLRRFAVATPGIPPVHDFVMSRLSFRVLAPLGSSILLAAATSLAAQEITAPAANRALTAPRVGSAHVIRNAPVIDGRLDEAEWKEGSHSGGSCSASRAKGRRRASEPRSGS